jgi:hypothetical protein
MTSLFTARRRAEEFAAVLDGEADADAGRHAEVDRLLGVVSALHAHPSVVPRAEFTSDLRDRLLAEAQHVLTAENAGLALPVRTRGARERRLVAAASTVVLIGGTAGMAAAAQDALPGEALYPIKRGIERAEAGLSVSQAGKGRDLLNQADDRLTEVQRLIAKDSAASIPQVATTLDSFSSQATEGANLLLDSFQDNRDSDSVVRVRSFAADGIASLGQLADSVPADAEDELAAAAVTLRDLDQQAAGLCDTCASDLPVVEIPGMILVRDEVDRALDAAVPANLDNSHPVVVPKGTVQQARPADKSAGGPAKAGGQTDGKASGAGPDQNGATGEDAPVPIDPDNVQPPTLPDLETEVTGGTKKPTDTPKKVVDEVTDGLNGAVETLLPDTGADPGVGGLLP